MAAEEAARLPPLAARIVGVEHVARPLVPLLAVNTLGTVSFSQVFAFAVVWATVRLDASGPFIGAAFLASALLSAAVGAVGGALSDRVGRRPLILAGWAFSGIGALCAWAAGTSATAGLAAFVVAGALGSLGQGADMALVADLVPEAEREQAYAAIRLCANLGAAIGPLIGAATLALAGWSAFFAVACTCMLGAVLAAVRWLPARGRYTPERAARVSPWLVLRDLPFVAFWASALCTFMIYTSYEVLLPRFLLEEEGYPDWAWGLLLAINPVLVVLFQMRVTQWSSRRAAPGRQLAIATLVMGLPFLVLLWNASAVAVVVVLVAFVIGEMLWVPTGQALAERLSPPHLRGAYMGAFGATGSVAFALGPFLGLSVDAAAGPTAMWLAVAGLAVVGAVLVVVVVGRVRERIAVPAAGASAQPPP